MTIAEGLDKLIEASNGKGSILLEVQVTYHDFSPGRIPNYRCHHMGIEHVTYGKSVESVVAQMLEKINDPQPQDADEALGIGA